MIGFLFAQTPPVPAPAVPSLAPLLRRFFQGGLAAPPGSIAHLLIVFLTWVAFVAVVVAILEGDWRKWLRGLVDIRAHFELLGAGLEILRRNKRPLWVTLAAAVLSWTVWSLRIWSDRSYKDEIESMLALGNNSAAAFAWKHAFASAIVPLRDLVSLGDLLPLVIAAGVMLFARSRTADAAQHLRAKTRAMENVKLKRRLGTIWVGLIVFVAYRAVGYTVDTPTAPMASGCLFIDALVLPFAVLVADGLLLSWILCEFARGLTSRFDWDASDTTAFARGIPAAMCVCALSNPGRYVALACAMWEHQVTSGTVWPASKWAPILWAAAVGQVFGVVWFALPAVLVVHRRGRLIDKFYAYVTLLRRAGGQLIGLTLLAVVLNMLVMLPFYWVFGKMQPETWSLVGAASYGHYVTLLLGLVLLAGVTQLAHKELGLEEDPGPAPILLDTPAANQQWVVVG